uniref:band 4.1-like protein 3b isoform X10 n=1 Tax=Doryrhamphus excisus TaxID=161450 RepID=UPI0025AE0A48|nr:band 4.1-like protein 3b isoform X10 [Doryrhamphus excisus]
MTTKSGADSEARQQQEDQPEQLPPAVGHSTPARKDQEQQEGDQVSRQSSTSLSRSPSKGAKKAKIMQCKVTLLDGSDFTFDVEKRVKSHVLFDKVCDHLNLLEKDYFGITYRDVENQKNWLDPSKDLKKQIRTLPWNFAFNVKFYPPDPSQLTEDITRYYLCLQLRDDVVSGRLPCSFATHTVLGSYTVQSELGDYDPEELASDYISELRFAPNQTKELEEKVMELHKTYKGMTPAEAEIHFLENAKKLSMYGVDLHHAKLVGLAHAEAQDSEGVEIMLGVCASGLLIYRDRLRINRFAWPKILKISYKRNNFYIKIRPGEFEQFESTIGFKLPNHRAAKRLWKVCVEHHTFFRLVSPEAPPKKFLTMGSKFRYSGRTQAQTRRASSQIIRPAPFFERSASKRYTMSRSLDGAPITENHETLMKDSDGAARGDIITTITTEKKAEEEKAEQEDARGDAAATTPLRQEVKTDSEQTDFALDGDMTATESDADEDSEVRTQSGVLRRVKEEAVFVKHGNLMLEDMEPPPEMVKHQANISELKRSFLEMDAAAPGLTEWDRRLSSSPAREAPMIEPLDLQDNEDGVLAGTARKEEPKATEAAGDLLICGTDSEAAPEPRGISPPTAVDGGLFQDGMAGQAEEKSPDSQEELSEKSLAKVSPGSVREEVSQAIIDKRGMLIILKEAEDKEHLQTVIQARSPSVKKMETLMEDMSHIKAVGSPKKAMASWVSEVLKAEESEVFSVLTEEMKTFEESGQKADAVQEQSETDVAHIPLPETTALAVVTATLGRLSSSSCQKVPAGPDQKAVFTTETDAHHDQDVIGLKETPVIHTETKTITYESGAGDMNGDADPGVLLSAQTITSETTSTTTTTHITKTVKGGISETRIEKRIVITGDSDIDHDEALAQAIKEAKDQHPDMSVTKVVVHKETEITPEEGED